MPNGSCLCGAVTFEAHEPLENFIHCHCSMCRKIHGTPFGSYVRSKQVNFKSGKGNIARYESSPGFCRCFCDQCGSVLPEDVDGAEYYFVPAGGLDDAIAARPEKHIFAGSKADWYQITDSLPQVHEYDSVAMDQGLESMPQPDRSGAEPNHVSGSCLCGQVAFKYKAGSAKLMMLCHCSRCRKVKGAAHAANVFVKPDDFEWTKGEDQLVNYDLPDAERFGNSFCKHCGSSVPRQSSKSPMVNIPAGVLDDAPGIEPKCHIFVGSKADWFDVTGETPQHDEMPPA